MKERKGKTVMTRLWEGRRGFAGGCGLILLMLGGCASTIPGDFCLLYMPVYTHPQDTEETRRQADINNILYADMCEGG